jgi:recombination protein RecR
MTQVMKLPRVISRLSEKFERLPGVGPKGAARIVFYLLHNPESELVDFAEKLVALKKETCTCEICHNIAESNPCEVCADKGREGNLLCVVEQPLDLIALERAGKYHGHYHVLHGCIDPLNHIGPEQLYLLDLLGRLEGVEEVIMATNPTMEGEATALFIKEMIKKSPEGEKIRVTRIGHGLPVGANIEYADGVTLNRSLAGRQEL